MREKLLFGWAVFTVILLMNQVARQFDELARRDLDPAILAQFFLLTLPFILAVTFPMGVLVATLAAFGRLSADHEITAMKASGVSLYAMLTPLMGAAGLLAVGMIWFNHAVLPETNHQLKLLLMDVNRKSPTLQLKEQVINEIQTRDLTTRYFLQAARIDPMTNRLSGVVIYDLSVSGRDRTVYADSGRRLKIAYSVRQAVSLREFYPVFEFRIREKTP